MQGSQRLYQSIRRCLYLWFSITYLILNWGPMGVIGILENGYQSFTPLPSYKYPAISSSENENDDFLLRKGNIFIYIYIYLYLCYMFIYYIIIYSYC